MKRVFVLDANQRSALATTRTLGKHHVPVITGDESSTSLAGSSRYSLHYASHPSPRLHPDLFITAIAKICAEQNIDIIFPMTELTTGLLLNNQDKLPQITLPLADIQQIDALADKCSLMKLAQSLDIPIPQTQYYDNAEISPETLKKMHYPLVMKPAKSWLEHNGKWIHTCVQIADTAEQAIKILRSDIAFQIAPFMLQEHVPGKGEGVFALYNRGKPLTFFAHKRLREKPPQGGVSVLSKSALVDADLEAYSRKLLEKVNWHGVAMVEFRVDDNKNAYLMEINTRFWGSLQLAIDAGVDFPWLLYKTACQMKTEPVKHYKTGVRVRWMLGNIDWLYLILRDKRYSTKEKISAAIAFITPSLFKTKFEVFRLHDLKPFLWELKNYIADLRR